MNNRIYALKIVTGTICIITINIFLLAGCTTVQELPFLKKGSAPNIPFIPEQYIIGCGDILDVNVWKDAELSKRVVVLPDGTFSYPLIGKIEAKDKTLLKLTNIINEKISYYIPEPNVSVQVVKSNSMKIYILGKVIRPGMFVIDENITVLQALALAGGLNSFADKHKIKIYRQTDDWMMIIPFDYTAVIKKSKIEQNILLKRGDLIIVP